MKVASTCNSIGDYLRTRPATPMIAVRNPPDEKSGQLCLATVHGERFRIINRNIETTTPCPILLETVEERFPGVSYTNIRATISSQNRLWSYFSFFRGKWQPNALPITTGRLVSEWIEGDHSQLIFPVTSGKRDLYLVKHAGMEIIASAGILADTNYILRLWASGNSPDIVGENLYFDLFRIDGTLNSSYCFFMEGSFSRVPKRIDQKAWALSEQGITDSVKQLIARDSLRAKILRDSLRNESTLTAGSIAMFPDIGREVVDYSGVESKKTTLEFGKVAAEPPPQLSQLVCSPTSKIIVAEKSDDLAKPQDGLMPKAVIFGGFHSEIQTKIREWLFENGSIPGPYIISPESNGCFYIIKKEFSKPCFVILKTTEPAVVTKFNGNGVKAYSVRRESPLHHYKAVFMESGERRNRGQWVEFVEVNNEDEAAHDKVVYLRKDGKLI